MNEHRAIFLFASASLVPAVSIVLAAAIGGGWAYTALAAVTLLVVLMDRAGPGFEAEASLTHWLPWAVATAHFVCLGSVLWALGASNALDTGQKLVLGVTMGLFAGQVSNAAAHELIHCGSRIARWIGTAMYCSVLNGQHVSAHLLVHHVHAGTPQDPCSAPVGRGFYRFALKAAKAEFVEGWRAENRRRAGHAGRIHPYVVYLGGAALSLMVATLLGGPVALLALLVISVHAQMQLLLSDYVQHYGLRRRKGPDGKPEPMGPVHSWNAPQPYSAALMMNAPRHSDHHMQPRRSFAELRLNDAHMPMLPRSMPVMGAIALIPPLWRSIMDPRVAQWMRDTPRRAIAPATTPLTSR